MSVDCNDLEEKGMIDQRGRIASSLFVCLPGEHDFETFRSQCHSSNCRFERREMQDVMQIVWKLVNGWDKEAQMNGRTERSQLDRSLSDKEHHTSKNQD